MKAWIFAGAASIVFLPAAAYAERTEHAADCQVGNARHQACIDSSIQPPAPQVQQPAVQRAEAQAPHPVTQQRRRNGKHIPDAELIGPRGAL
jgi:hypothetical protein